MKAVYTAVFREGEFDSLSAQQEAGSLITVVTLGSAVNPLAKRWLSELVGCQTLLIVYATDEAGRRGAQRLLTPCFRSIDVPQGKDITKFYLSGGDVYTWNKGVLTKASAT